MGKKAVVLGGGGSRGSYQVGVWKALTELGFDYTVVTGTSVGALNGAFMAQQEFPLVEKMWKSIRTADVMDIRVDGKVEGVRDLTDKAGAFLAEMVKNGGADPRPLENMLREYTDEEKIRQSPIDFGFVTVAFPSMEPKTFTKSTVPKGQLVDHLMASAACFPAMKARVIDQKTYIDGGYWDNVPVQMAVEMGADDIIAVDLDSIGVVRKLRFPGVRVRHLKSRWDLGVFLLFDGDVTVRNMQLGYLETMKLFSRRDRKAVPAGQGTGAAFYGKERDVPDPGQHLHRPRQSGEKASSAAGPSRGQAVRQPDDPGGGRSGSAVFRSFSHRRIHRRKDGGAAAGIAHPAGTGGTEASRAF